VCSRQLAQGRSKQPLPTDSLEPYTGETAIGNQRSAKDSERKCVGPKLPVEEFKTFPAKTKHKINTADNQRKEGNNQKTTKLNSSTSTISKRPFDLGA